MVVSTPLLGDRLQSRSRWLRITLPSGADRRFWFADLTQVVALGEVLVDGDYDIAVTPDPRTILDLGANAGQASLFLRDRFPGARIVAVEADPLTAALAARNLGDGVTVVSAAVADHDGTAVITRVPGESWATTLFSWGAEPDDAQHAQVPTVTLDTLLRQQGLERVDLLKVDVEGAELLALTSDDALERVAWVVGELHPRLLQMSADEALERLRRHGGFDRGWLHRPRIMVLARGS